jgi:hypothetical protein
LLGYNDLYPLVRNVVDFGYIARTEFSSRTQGSVTVSHTNPRLRIIGEYYFPIDGEPLDKMGYVTGWTWGGVSNTCFHTPRIRDPNGADIVYLCQTVVDAGATRGDSGSPVFSLAGGNDVNVIGILFSGYTDAAGQHFVFSPMNQIWGEMQPYGNFYSFISQ